MTQPTPSPAGPGQSLRHRISTELIRLIRGYVMVISALLALLALLTVYFFKLNQLTHQQQLVTTKISTELANVAHEMQSLATSSLVWTGLTDSFGRDSYLAPLLSRFNRGNLRHFLILDYRGRVFLAPDLPRAESVIASPSVIQAVGRGDDGYGMVLSAEGAPTFVLVQRVMSPASPAPVGFIVGTLDANALTRELGLEDALVSFGIGDSQMLPPLATGLLMRERVSTVVSPGDLNIALNISLAHPVFKWIAGGFFIVLAVFLVGDLTLRRVVAWAQSFSASTVGRLDELVHYCQRVLAGSNPSQPALQGPRDEITQVVETLSAMLLQQRQVTDELRTTSLVFSTAAEGIIVTDRQGQVVDINPALLRMTGFSREEIIGQLAGTLYRESDLTAQAQEITDALKSQGRWSGETTFVHRDGRSIPSSVSVSRIRDDEGRSMGHVAVITDISRIKEAENKLRDLAYRDPLTGLPNFRMMAELVQQRLATTQAPFALLFVDLDHLKAVNDGYDHEAGDRMICGMAEHLQRGLPSGHLLCRRSGDEFIALIDLGDGADATSWQPLVERLTRTSVQLPSGELTVSATIGVARFPQDAQTWLELQVCADVAMNAAKQVQRGSVAWYDSRLGQRAVRHRLVQQRLVHAIEQQAIRVHYQPVVDLRTGELKGLEALARWTDPELGEVRPSEFIAVAEEAQLSDRLTMQLLQIILADQPRIQAQLPQAVLAFNASPRVFRGNQLVNFLTDLAEREPQLLSLLEIELTETDIASGEAQLLRHLQLIHGLGVRLVIDDFGTGYSSLARLAQFPIHCLKIDSSFVASMGTGRQTKIVELIVNLAQLLDLQVTAEGVETELQRQTLLRMGCKRGQGWLFAKAMPLEALLQIDNPLVPEVLQAAPADA